ncbi:hypothetical protein ACQ4LE_001625 [Meloidogyne hapla]
MKVYQQFPKIILIIRKIMENVLLKEKYNVQSKTEKGQFIWTHFVRKSKKEALCNICSKVFKLSGSTTTNLWYHFITHVTKKEVIY